MSASLATAVVLALAAALAMWRRRRRRVGEGSETVWGQPLVAALFFLILFPPHTTLRGDAITVLTPGATSTQLRALPRGQRVVVLPDAPAISRAERVPDLATALRRFPGVRELDIVGNGLPARDQDAATELAVRFAGAPIRGLSELSAPEHVLAGAQWRLSGRAAPNVASVELLDPAGIVSDATPVTTDGGFALSALARAEGPARFELRALDERREIVDRASVTIVARAGATLSMSVRAGTPDPELKYLRRWAADAGFDVRFGAGLSEGVMLRDGDARLTPESLAEADVLLIDERAWLTLDADEKIALDAAVADGLGVVLRISGPLDASVATEWESYGYRVANAEAPRTVTLDRELTMQRRTAFTAAPVQVHTNGATPMLVADDGDALAWWHPRGRGRVALWSLTDSYRLVLLGEAARHGTLWSEALSAVARARVTPPEPQLPADAWANERAVLCRLGDTGRVLAPDGGATDLVVDARGCAAWWPAVPGWHRLQSAGVESPVYVRAAGDGEGLRATRNGAATLALRPVTGSAHTPGDAVPMSRWPFFFAWLLLAATLWWREKTA